MILGSSKAGVTLPNKNNTSVAFSTGNGGFDLTGLKTYNKCDVADSPDENVSTSDDTLGSASDLTCNNTTFQQTGVLEYAISFNGTSSEGIFGTSTTQFDFLYSTSYEFSINFWYAKLASAPNKASVFMNMRTSGSTSSGIQIKFDDRDAVKVFEVSCKLCNSAYIDSILSTAIPADTSYHMITITGNNSDSGWKFYIDGGSAETINEASSPSGSCNADIALEIAQENSAEFWAGKLCEVSIWSRVLSTDEISELYNDGNGLAL